MSAYKYIEDFEIVDNLDHNNCKDDFHHSVMRVRKKAPSYELDPDRQKYQNIWYAKKCDNLQEALCELLAQELLRLFYPLQPKTRLAYSKTGEFYILSKEVPGFSPIHLKGEDFKNSVQQRFHKGLGIILILALFIQEVDLKLDGNIGQDENLNILKLDGDNCLVKLFRNIVNHFSGEDIESLPFIENYYSYNWFDLVDEERINEFSDLFVDGFDQIPALRQEINQTILAILLMSHAQLKSFIEYYLSHFKSLCDLVVGELDATKNKLRQAAFQSPSFIEFFSLVQENDFIEALSQRFLNFTNAKKEKVFKNTAVKEVMTMQFNDLCANDFPEAIITIGLKIPTQNSNASQEPSPDKPGSKRKIDSVDLLPTGMNDSTRTLLDAFNHSNVNPCGQVSSLALDPLNLKAIATEEQLSFDHAKTKPVKSSVKYITDNVTDFADTIPSKRIRNA